MSIVVTGASGYLGRYVTELLTDQGVPPVALGRSDRPGFFTCRRTGMTAPLASFMTDAIGVVHLAGQLVRDPTAGVEAYFDANVALTDQVALAAVEAGVPIVVHASSRLVYPSTLTEAAREDRDARPDTPYGLSKSWAEDVLRVRTMDTRTSAVSLRIGQVTGGDHAGIGVIRSFLQQAEQTRTVRINGRGAALRDIVHVQDVARATMQALEYRGDWLAINVGGVAPVSIAQIAHAVAECAGVPGENVVHKETTAEDLSCYALDSERARAVLGWHATTSLNSIVAEVMAARDG
nr:NAD(P)-dependent oxidoreductase [Demequina aurantiaca]